MASRATQWRVGAAAAAAAAAGIAYVAYRRATRGWRLCDKVTVILCTSPVKTNPSTALIEETYGSMVHYAPALAGCATIVICDGYKVRAAPKYRSGQVTEAGAAAYEAFVAKLRALKLGRLVRCEERQGFGFALKRALTHVRTPYVVVVQHDRNFVRAVDIAPIVRCMEAHSDVKYVGLPTSTTLHYARLDAVERRAVEPTADDDARGGSPESIRRRRTPRGTSPTCSASCGGPSRSARA